MNMLTRKQKEKTDACSLEEVSNVYATVKYGRVKIEICLFMLTAEHLNASDLQ